jgi:hypothetical protein
MASFSTPLSSLGVIAHPSASIVVEPVLHLGKLLPQSCRRHSNPDPNWEAALGVSGRDLRWSHHAPCACVAAEERNSLCLKSRPVISTLPSSVNCRRRTFRSEISSSRVRWT